MRNHSDRTDGKLALSTRRLPDEKTQRSHIGEKALIPFPVLAIIAFVFACCSDGGGGSVSISDVCNAECEQRQKCNEDIFYEQFDSFDDCLEVCLDEPEDYESLFSECQDIYLDYWMCLNTLSCEEYESDDSGDCDTHGEALDDCYENNTEFCEGYSGEDLCCQEDNPCDYSEGAECLCDGACEWEAADCG